MEKVLILFAHPRFEKSRINRGLLRNIENLTQVTLHDLYEEYPDFNIDTDREKSLLLNHEIIVWHHPFYMYGVPALLKQWIDLVLEYGWAHGEGGDNLRGKIIFNTLTAGGTRNVYTASGHNGFTIREFLVPFEQTARFCKMTYFPPFVVHGTYLLTDEEVEAHRKLYHALLDRLARGEYDTKTLLQHDYLNDWLTQNNGAGAP
jgi:glutathione-regulated potassium-efflux system ancillary protein KefG